MQKADLLHTMKRICFSLGSRGSQRPPASTLLPAVGSQWVQRWPWDRGKKELDHTLWKMDSIGASYLNFLLGFE